MSVNSTVVSTRSSRTSTTRSTPEELFEREVEQLIHVAGPEPGRGRSPPTDEAPGMWSATVARGGFDDRLVGAGGGGASARG